MRDVGSFELTVDVRRHRSVIPQLRSSLYGEKINAKRNSGLAWRINASLALGYKLALRPSVRLSQTAGQSLDGVGDDHDDDLSLTSNHMVCMLSKVSGALGHRASMVLKRVRRDQLDTASFVFSVIKAQEFINQLCL